MKHTQFLLALAAEEAVEVAHRATKALRFGLDEVQAGQNLTNAERLRQEFVDLVAVLWFLEEHTGERLTDVHLEEVDKKIEKIEKYMKVSRERGWLNTDANLG